MGTISLGVLVVLGFLVLGALAILLDHIQTMAKVRAQNAQQRDEALQHRMEELVQQVEQLRQMHTDYVLNMDSHLQHLEFKLSAVEQRLEQLESQQGNLHR